MQRYQPVFLSVFVALAFFAVFSFVRVAVDAETRRSCAVYCPISPHYAGQERRAPDFALPVLMKPKDAPDAATLSMAELRGQTVVLHFWTKSCAPCLDELPVFAEYSRRLRKRVPDVSVVTVSTDPTADIARSTVESVLGTKQLPFYVLHDPDSQVVAGKFGTKLYPETWFVDARGVVRARVDGAKAKPSVQAPWTWNDALPISFVQTIATSNCSLAFRAGEPVGAGAEICGG